MKKKWSKEEKLKIVKESEREGVQVTLRKYGVYPTTFYYWRKKYRIDGAEGLGRKKRVHKDEAYVKQMEDELDLYKRLLAERDLEIALQDELLKKKYPWARKKK